MPMKLQLTLDSPSVEDCLDLVLATRDSIDIIEVGYPLLVEEGLSLVRHVKHAFPDKTVLADAKIFHSGGYVSEKCFLLRSEERRVGKECRSRWSPYH